MRALLLPFTIAPLLLVAIFSLLLVLGVNAGLMGVAIVFIVASWFLKYGFILLDHVANGRPGAPVLAIEDVNPFGETRPAAYAALAIVFWAVTALLGQWLAPEIATVLRMLGLVALPAVVATQCVTGSFVQALHPVAVAEVARRLGPGYLWVLAVALACGAIGRSIVLDLGQLALYFRIALLMLLWLEFFAVLGSVIHARRLELAFDPERSPERSREREATGLARERDRFMDQVFQEQRTGATQNALATIRARVAASDSPIDECAWIHERVVAWPNAKLANALALELLPRLLAARRTGEAIKVVKARLQSDAGFRPATGEQALQLVDLARAAGERTVARQLLVDFEARYPDAALHSRAQRLRGELGNR